MYPLLVWRVKNRPSNKRQYKENIVLVQIQVIRGVFCSLLLDEIRFWLVALICTCLDSKLQRSIKTNVDTCRSFNVNLFAI